MSTAQPTPVPPASGPERSASSAKNSGPFRQVQAHTIPLEVKRGFFESLFEKPEFASNEIRTSKYSLLTFIPVNLFEQFTRVANLYFLFIAGIQLIPGLSPTSWFTTVMPLAFVLIINAIKEGYDDYFRHKSDKEINAKKVLVLHKGGKETPVQWRDVVVGDIIKVMQDEEIPADLVFLASSDAEGLCYVETANLDGETNLKVKFNYMATAGARTADELEEFAVRNVINCEAPNARLYVFDGAVATVDSDVQPEPLTADNLLLRGCTLRKTDWVIGVAVFTGADSKIMMNRTVSPRKVTQLERHMNVLVLLFFGILLFFAIMLAAGDQIWMRIHGEAWYLNMNGDWPDLGPGFPGWIIQVIRFIILMNGLIPISLYITLECVKVFQCVLVLNSDLQMYCKDSDVAFACRTTNLNEDLGQVEYVLSDKTGTLTQNVMGFVWASIGGQLYGNYKFPSAGGPGDYGVPPTAGTHPSGKSYLAPGAALHPEHIPARTPHSIALDPTLLQKLGSHFERHSMNEVARRQAGSGPSSEPLSAARSLSQGATQDADRDVMRFYINLAVCNTVVPGVAEDGSLVYQASSPDEEALVQGAAYLGYKLLNRATDKVDVYYHGQEWTYQVLAVLEFNSDRKRMSIICRCPDGKIRLFCKGADTMIMARIRQGQSIVPKVRNHLEEMSVAGYRTLCIAERELTEQQYQQWAEQYKAASTALENREEQVARVSERIEVELELLGATAVEDKLQEGVPEAIDSLIKAGIKVWVLTGDKVETAINIALSCRLFTDSMSLVELRERDLQNCTSVEDEVRVLQAKIQEVETENQDMGVKAGESNVGLVVEGGALVPMLQEHHQAMFTSLCSSCKSVVCCRVSPMQKANMTKMVKKQLNAITLGIGDGANDVGMIQAAHIGCGISGREGRAAVLASDFSFGQFRFLARLLLVHGRLAYKRNTEVVLYSFYKNWVQNITYLIYAFASAFSSQPLYTSGLIATLNVLWSSYVIVGYAVLEQDVSQATATKYPVLYTETMHDNRAKFLKKQIFYLCEATWHSLVNYFLPMYTMCFPGADGNYNDWVDVGCTIYTATVITINLRLAMMTRYWTWITHLLTWLSITTFFAFLWLYGLVWRVAQIEGTADMVNMALRLFPSPKFWLAGVLLAPVLSLLPDFTIDSFQRHFRPKMYQIFQELEWREELKEVAVKELGLVIKDVKESEEQA